jgi:hypothetical protein
MLLLKTRLIVLAETVNRMGADNLLQPPKWPIAARRPNFGGFENQAVAFSLWREKMQNECWRGKSNRRSQQFPRGRTSPLGSRKVNFSERG